MTPSETYVPRTLITSTLILSRYHIDGMINVKAVCISHAEDADGLICAAYLRHLMDVSTLLVTYDEFENALKSVRSSTNEVYICDLNIREEFYEEIQRITRFASVTLIDHHPTDVEMVEILKQSGVTVIYNPLDCASVLLFDYFKKKLSRKAARLAAYAAVSDQFEDGPIASNILARLDRQFVQHEALILTHALYQKTTSKFRSSIVEELSRFSFPHKIKGVVEASLIYLEHTSMLLENLPTKASRIGRLAYVEGTYGISIGAVAGLLVDAMNVDVGVCYKRVENGLMNLSIRGRRGLEIHLGAITKRMAKRYSGFGGGHKRASGASIPRNNYLEFIRDLERELKRKVENSISS